MSGRKADRRRNPGEWKYILQGSVCRVKGPDGAFRRRMVFFLCMILMPAMLLLQSDFRSTAAEYTYTVTFYPGNHGTFESHEQVSVDNRLSGSSVSVSGDGDLIRVSGLKAGDMISFDASMEGAVALDEGSRYYVKGIRQGGRDNSTVDVPAFRVEGDQDYVVAYGIRGDMTAYVVHYQDAAGNTLAQSRTYYGNIGDKPVIAFLYIEGYQPQAYNLTKTLSANEAENVFTFVYTPIPAAEEGGGENQGGAGNQPGAGTGGAGTQPGTAAGAGTQPGTTGGAGNQPGNAGGTGNQPDTQGQEPPANTPDDGGTPEEGGQGSEDQSPEENVVGDDQGEGSEGPRDLVDLDEDEVPLGGYGSDGTEKKGLFGLPVWAGAGVIAATAGVIVLGICLILMRRKKVKKEKDA